MNFLKDKISGIKRRLNSIHYGMFYLWNRDYKIPGQLRINGKKTTFQLEDVNTDEFTGICINDCYHLKYLRKNIKNIRNIVDVGANHGMFLIAARQNFPDAKVTAYEPNGTLKSILDFNAGQLNVETFYEAVMKDDCLVDLNFKGSDLATTVSKSERGKITGISLKNVLKRSGGIDILKLDCEGAEWGLLEDTESWKEIKSLTMEYHLWAREGSTTADILKLVKENNFEVLHHNILSADQGIVIAINKKNPMDK